MFHLVLPSFVLRVIKIYWIFPNFSKFFLLFSVFTVSVLNYPSFYLVLPILTEFWFHVPKAYVYLFLPSFT